MTPMTLPLIAEATWEAVHPKKQLRVGMAVMQTDLRGSDTTQTRSYIPFIAEYDIFVFPEYCNTPEDFVPSVEECKRNIETLLVVSEHTLVVTHFNWRELGKWHNGCKVLYGGENIGEYLKVKTSSEEETARYFRLSVASGDAPLVLQWEGVKIGIEICADFGLLPINGHTDLDLSILVSCGNYYVNTPALRDGGHHIIVDGYKANAGVWKKEGERAFPLPLTHNEQNPYILLEQLSIK